MRWAQAGIYFRPGKIIQAAKNLGVGVRAFEATADYVQNYVQGGRILIKHQAVALRLADMATRIEAVRALLERAAQAVDDNAPDAEVLCNMAKMFASEEIMKVAQHAVELHGGNGIMLDFGIEKLLARRRHLPAHGRDDGHLQVQDRQEHVPGDGGQIRGAGVMLHPRKRADDREWRRDRGCLNSSRSPGLHRSLRLRGERTAAFYRTTNLNPISTTTRPMSCGRLGTTPSAR